MADSEKKVGITISLKDKVTAEAKKIKDGFVASRKAVDQFGKTGEKQLKTIAKAVVVLNQGLALVGKVWRGVSNLVSEHIQASLEMRAETDRGKQSWAEMMETIKSLSAHIGDFFIPIVLGVYDAFKPVIASAQEWLSRLRETQGSGFVEWLMGFGKTMISVVATSVVAVTRTWTFLMTVVEAFRVAVQKVWGAMIRGASMASGAVAKLAAKVGLDGLAGAMQSVSQEAGIMADVYAEGVDASVEEINRLLDRQREIERVVGDVEQKITQTFGQAGPAIMARFKDAVVKANPALKAVGDEGKQAAEKIVNGFQKAGDAIQLMIQKRTAMWEREADAIERNAILAQQLEDQANEAAEAQTQAAQDSARAMVAGYGQVRGAALTLFQGIAEGGDAAKGAMLSVANTLAGLAEQFIAEQIAMMIASQTAGKAQIATSAAAGGAKAVEAHAGIPFVGAVIGAAAAAAIVALIMGFASQMQHGGIVGGNGRMGDRHLVLAEQGESVLDRETTGALVAALSGQGRRPVSRSGSSKREREAREGSGRTVIISHAPQMLAMPNSADYQRNYRDSVLPVQRRLAKLGAM